MFNLMPRRRNDKPTSIYWLIDMRPEIIAAGWHSGYPFYCGKTVIPVEWRLTDHIRLIKKYPNRKVSQRLTLCGDHVRVETMEVVPPDASWSAREKHWIKILRFSFPDNCNVAEGGGGCPGWVPTEETRRRISEALKNLPAEVRARMDAERKPMSAQGRANLRAAKLKQSPETRRKIGDAHLGMKHSDEMKAALRAMNLGKEMPADVRRKISEKLTGRETSTETRAKLSAKSRGRIFGPEARANMKAARLKYLAEQAAISSSSSVAETTASAAN